MALELMWIGEVSSPAEGYVAVGRHSLADMLDAIEDHDGTDTDSWGDDIKHVYAKARLTWPCGKKCRGCDCDDESKEWRIGHAGDPVCTIVLAPTAHPKTRQWLADKTSPKD